MNERSLQCPKCGAWWQPGQGTCHGCGSPTWMRVHGAHASHAAGCLTVIGVILVLLIVLLVVVSLWWKANVPG